MNHEKTFIANYVPVTLLPEEWEKREKVSLKESDGYLLVKDSMESKSNVESGSSGIVYCNYIPKQLTQADAEKRMKVRRAGKTYAKVKLSHPNPSYRGKRGIIWDKKDGLYLLEIETMNTTSENGATTWIGVTYPTGYTKIWFNADEVEDFETYDENGELNK